MIRPSVFAWVTLAGAVGVSLFQLKQSVRTMDEDLLRLNRQIAAEHQTIHLLRAQWSRSNQPQHLESLSRIALDIEPMKPGQMARLGDIPFRPAAPARAQDAQPAPSSIPAAGAPPPPPPAPPAPQPRARVQAGTHAGAPAIASVAEAGPGIARGGR
ncbi:MAG: hypothetical protein FJX69_00425 [Alphaproteobacteria bacterium]|nr:hypothetical protein [Alphaproteobacteria bacterium]